MGNRKKRHATWRWRSATRVVDGVVQPKNRRATSDVLPESLVVERERPGRGFRHLLGRDDVFRFLDLLEDRASLLRGLHTIRLAAGSYAFGYWYRGVAAVCAFPEDRRLVGCNVDAYARRFFDELGVRPEPGRCRVCGDRGWAFSLSIEQARAWQLLDVLMHELGHHHDAMTNRSRRTARGEQYALRFAEEQWHRLWLRYQRAFAV